LSGLQEASVGPPTERDTEGPPHHSPLAAVRQQLPSVAVVGMLGLLIVVFGALRPDTFLTWSNFQAVAGQNAVLIILSLGAMLPLIANEFDLSVANVMGLAAVLTAGLPVRQDLGVVATLAVVLVVCAVIGCAHAVLIVRYGLPSFVTTLATGTAVSGAVLYYTGGNVIFGMPEAMKSIASTRVLGLQLPVYYALAIALVLYFVLEKRPWGRHLYATGTGVEAARLAGVATNRLRASSLVACSVLAGVAGVILAARAGAVSPVASQAFFLPAFAAVFLGTAAFKLGFFNAWGTVVAVLLISVGVTGLNLMGVPFWVEPVFNGFALLVAVAFSRAGPAIGR
jgi:ribose transport system permease protein